MDDLSYINPQGAYAFFPSLFLREFSGKNLETSFKGSVKSQKTWLLPYVSVLAIYCHQCPPLQAFLLPHPKRAVTGRQEHVYAKVKVASLASIETNSVPAQSLKTPGTIDSQVLIKGPNQIIVVKHNCTVSVGKTVGN